MRENSEEQVKDIELIGLLGSSHSMKTVYLWPDGRGRNEEIDLMTLVIEGGFV